MVKNGKSRSRSKSKSKKIASRSKPSKSKKPSKKLVDLYKQKGSKKEEIYLDINATTPMCPEALKALNAWASCGNPSSTSSAGIEAKMLINQAIEDICKHCNISPKKYTVLFTPSASAANSQILQSTSHAYHDLLNKTPHIITSSIEHKSLLSCASSLEDRGLIELTCIEPDIYGIIDPDLVASAIKPNTAMISIMAVNNELGSKNNIRRIGEIAKKHNIAFHCDAVQLFGKERIQMAKLGIDAMSVSFHKLYGPKGLGLLIISNNFVDGYQLKSCPLIFGTQQQGLLGGTENVALIASGLAALKSTFTRREEKNKKIEHLASMIIDGLSQKIPLRDSYDEEKIKTIQPYELVILGPPRNQKSTYVSNTLLISIVDNKKKFCNIKLKECLAHNNVVVSIGSACNTDNKSASHVLHAIRAPDKIKSGIIRISLGDGNTSTQIKKFIDIFIKCVGKQIPSVLKPRQSKPRRLSKSKSRKTIKK